MNRIAQFVVEHTRMVWLCILLVVAGTVLLSGRQMNSSHYTERLSLLNIEAERLGIEIMSETMNGNLMGSVTLLGVIDEDVKRDARGETPPNSRQTAGLLEKVGRTFHANGVFVVGTNGILNSSWNNGDKPSTGLNVKFRPYFQMAMQGTNNVYAAVSLARGDRALYFSSPIFAGTGVTTPRIGALVARTGLSKVDSLLKKNADIALLLSPQGVVFASSRKEWIGFLAGAPTPERLKAIRELKQFGAQFENSEPRLLPVGTDNGFQRFDGRRYAAASAKVLWNDPYGDWKLVLLEDLSRTAPLTSHLPAAVITGLFVLILALPAVSFLRGHHARILSTRQIQAYAADQEQGREYKAQLTQLSFSLQQASSTTELGRIFLTEAHRMTGMLQGVIYAVDAESGGVLRLIASYACAVPPPAELKSGEGLLGQCALERRIQVIETAADTYRAIRSGLGETAPQAVMMTPVLLNNNLLGMIEVALLTVPGLPEQEQFEEMVRLLAINLEIVGRSERTEAALAATVAAEAANADHLAFQQVLIDTIPYPLFYKGADTRFIGFNRAYEETFAVRRETLIGKRVLDLDYLPEADRIAYQTEDEAAIAAAGTVRREVQIPFADGRLHDTLYFVSGFRRPDGTPGGLVGTFIDISMVKDAERDMARMADIEQFNRLAQGRERRILELKQEINGLSLALGRPEPYSTTLVETVGDHVVDPHPDYGPGGLTDEESLELGDLVDMVELQKLFSSFCDAIGIAAAIIDLKGTVLAASRWQRACTDFHRVNQDSCARCIESDTELALKLQDGVDFSMYTCKNGLTDCASPIIVENRHLANVFIGQFHLGPPDRAFFVEQAQRFGFFEEEYLQAINEAPVLDEQRLPAILGFLSGFARMIATMALARRRADAAQAGLERQAHLLRAERIAAMSLAEDAERARLAMEALSKELPS